MKPFTKIVSEREQRCKLKYILEYMFMLCVLHCFTVWKRPMRDLVYKKKYRKRSGILLKLPRSSSHVIFEEHETIYQSHNFFLFYRIAHVTTKSKEYILIHLNSAANPSGMNYLLIERLWLILIWTWYYLISDWSPVTLVWFFKSLNLYNLGALTMIMTAVWYSGSERSPRNRKVEHSNHSRDKP